MVVKLLHNTPLTVVNRAIGMCWDKHMDMDSFDIKTLKRIYKVGHKNKHGSTLEHVSYNFEINGVSRALLQELARHRIASLSVKSSRYTLKELLTADRVADFLVETGIHGVDRANWVQLVTLRDQLLQNKSIDYVKYMLPEAYKTSFIWTINMRSLRNFIALRSNKSALWEIRDLAHEVYKMLPTTHKFMFVESLDDDFYGEWDKDLIVDINAW